MKTILASLLLLMSGVAFAQDGGTIMELRAVEVSYFGGITGFDEAGYKALRSAIGHLVAEGTLAQFRTTSVGMEGGGSFCVELSGDPKLKVTAITNVLEAIKPSAITVYSHDLRLKCD
jgi:hypothetical protein